MMHLYNGRVQLVLKTKKRVEISTQGVFNDGIWHKVNRATLVIFFCGFFFITNFFFFIDSIGKRKQDDELYNRFNTTRKIEFDQKVESGKYNVRGWYSRK